MIDINDLKQAIDDCIGKEHAHYCSDFFRHGEFNTVFVVVKNTKNNTFYVFYDEGDDIKYKLIGDDVAFSKFIKDSYELDDFDVNDASGFYKRVNKQDHIYAMNGALCAFHYAKAFSTRNQAMLEAEYL